MEIITQILLIFLLLLPRSLSFEFFVPIKSFYSEIKCGYWTECCSERHVIMNITGLKHDLETQLYGQPLVASTVFKAVKGHVRDPNPARPLVMSFHGATGTGKNYVANMLTKNLYKFSEKSKFVKFFHADVHFKNPDKVVTYQNELQSLLSDTTSSCGRSLFIFDELDHVPQRIFDALSPYLGNYPSIDGIDYRKNIFIFMSNSGGRYINQFIMNSTGNMDRKYIPLKSVQDVVAKSLFTDQNGLKFSKIIDKDLIDHYIPFFPLERGHVRMCARDELRRLNISRCSDDDIEKILDELSWYEHNKLYAKSGCKKVSQKIHLHCAE